MRDFDFTTLDDRARDILRLNDRGGYTVPTDGLYPYQWNWDSALTAWGLASFDPVRAWTEVETLLACQWPSGMVPHIIFHKEDPRYFPGVDVWGTRGMGPVASSGISQPPLAATMIRHMWDRDPEGARDRLLPLLPRLQDWHRWFHNWRTTPEGMVIITHPWEAGRDNSADWDGAMAMIDPVGVGEYTRRDTSHVDPAMRPTKADYDRYIWLVQRCRDLGWDEAKMAQDRPFAVADPTLTFTLLRANRDLAAMVEATGGDRSEIDGWIAHLEAGAEALRNPAIGTYNAINLRDGQHTGNLTSASFLCWYAGIDDAATGEALERSLASCRYPVASLDVDADNFEAMRYWRGPTWAIMNALICIGLRDMGRHEAAETLRERTCAMIAEHGFAEYFNPHTGAPAGGGTFSWTAAVWLAWASPSAGAK